MDIKKFSNRIAFVACASVLLAGCQSELPASAWSKATEDMLVRQQLQKLVLCPFFSGRRTSHVMSIGDIKNDTTLVADDNIAFIKSQIVSELTNSGVVMVSTAKDGRIDPSNGGNAVAPTLRLYGKLIQRDSRNSNRDLQHEFILELSIVDLATGIRIWSNKSVAGILERGK